MDCMDCYEITSPGTLVRTTRPAPRPGPLEVAVRLRAASLNYRDLLVLKGRYPNIRHPLVPLSDGAGEVCETGEGVTRFKVGDRVAAIFNQAWIQGPPPATPRALGGDIDGMLAGTVVMPESGLVRLPDSLSFEEGATLPCAAVTAWNALFESARLRPGQTVLVQGTGGVSLFALQFARMAGAFVILLSRSAEKIAHVLPLGVDRAIDTGRFPDWEREVLDLTGGRGVDHVVEVGGAETLPRSLAATRHLGHVAVIGVLSGGEVRLPIFALLSRQIRLSGIYVGNRDHFEAMNAAIATNGLHPHIGRLFPFPEAPEAFRTLESGEFTGKLVISFED
ncbi:MAG: zinc-dependent alcohol dehydrogenase family protein [Leptospirillia bacterium]